MNEQQIEKGHYFFENRLNMSTIIVFVGTVHKPKFSEIELLLRVFDHLPPPGFGGHVLKHARRNKPRKDDVFDAFRVCGIFGHAKSTIVLDVFTFFLENRSGFASSSRNSTRGRTEPRSEGPKTRARVRNRRFLARV